ncbi:glycerol-3-phosphate 1-O-acyltransferase PlsY [Phormidium sp. CCY1219]|uniref:glycerol-3-phosphate 1-O-acyltransferase PlsY n=1 Tax=Phormidium sp. CCY1219 TaxID=2886104 RepID=UPI002D1EDD45|nr:glycerol-3-phosphate 1-O-acyltransferase PlsY [Phormidium sp. CCY1219]MEB3828509.1 glycerol-3-phosphate 1-O-acyltransferase PlsY [Phormidium sp. CCY1219]
MVLWLVINFSLLIAGYLFGSIPTGYIVARKQLGIDIREEGSGSTGATNVLRTVGKGAALFVFLVDVSKGIAAIALVRALYSWPAMTQLAPPTVDPSIWVYWMAMVAGIAALVGHTKSVWIEFRGGKAVATSLGVLLALCWPVALLTFSVFGIMLSISRIVSLSSMSGAIALPAVMFLMNQPLPYLLFGFCAGFYVIWLHRSNIGRLMAGTEPRIGQKLQQQSESLQS